MQNLSKKRRKGFTLTELAIVIAVIAILIAVLVPTFVSIINKANESVDEQAVKNMNTALSIHESTEDFDTVADVVNALAEDSYDLDNYSPLISGMQFYWVKKYNRVVYADASTYAVSYPEEYTSLEYSAEDGWYSLNGNITLDNSWEVEGTGTERKVEISTGAQLASLMDSYSTYATSDTTLTIELQNDIDLMGASYKFGDTATSGSSAASYAVYSNLTITSADNKTYTIYGFRDDTNAIYGSGEYENKGYGYGLFCSINSGATVTIKNVNFNGMTVVDTSLEETGTLALIAGYCSGTLYMENVTFTDCYVGGQQKVATISGHTYSSSRITLKNVDFVNTTVAASCEGAKVLAYVENDEQTKQTFKYDNACDFSGITVVANDGFLDCVNDGIDSFTTTYTTAYGTYECVFAYHSCSGRGDLITVTTQALYIYTAYYTNTVTTDGTTTTTREEDNINDTTDKSGLRTVYYNYSSTKTSFILRHTNIPGSVEPTTFE